MNGNAGSVIMIGTTTRIAVALLVGLLGMFAATGFAEARDGHRHWRAHHHVVAATGIAERQSSTAGAMRYYGGPKSPMWRGPAATTQQMAVVEAPSHLGPMRYYGGPKSPMWRGPAEN